MIIDNRKINVKDVLSEWIDKSDEVFICSPFITSNDKLFHLLETDIKFTLICRLTYPASPDLFERIYSFSNKNNEIYLFDDDSLHSKIYYFKKKGKGIGAIIGSSNFTDSGIYSNKEYNLFIRRDLDKIEEYFKFLVDESYCKLDNNAIDYYKTFYKVPDRNIRFNKAKVSPKLVTDYSQVLEKFYTVKGLLEKENNTDLPFTYVFDTFCHYFKVIIAKELNLKPFLKFEKTLLINYFKLFLNDYLNEEVIDFRKQRLFQSQEIRAKFKILPVNEIRNFFLGIHSISSGSGSGVRVKNIKDLDKKILVELLDFIINSDLSMSQKYAIALTNRDKKGLKIDYIGESAIGEIPGWIIPENFPIKNSKLMYIYDFFKI